MRLDPNDPLDRLDAELSERARREAAVKPLSLYERGLITVRELADLLDQVAG